MGILIVLLLMSAPALAQTKALPDQGGPPTNLTRRADGHYTANMDPADADKYEVHIVQQGETLSAIAKASLDNPKLWPQLWEANDHIINPHWIYPNDRILVHRLTPRTPDPLTTVIPDPLAPPPIEIASAPQQMPPQDTPEPTPPPKKAIQYPTLILSAPAPPPPPRPPFELKLPASRPVAEIKQADLYCSGFIRHADVSDRLKVIGRFGADPGALATTTDYVYLNVDRGLSVQPGTMYQIVRPTRKIKDNQTSANLGRHFLDVGQIRVVLIQDDFALARVTLSCEALEIGDIVVPLQEMTVPQLARPRPFSPMMTSSGGSKGFVVLAKTAVSNSGSVYEASEKFAGVNDGRLSSMRRGFDSTGGIVYVDLGRPNGVAPGDIFIVYRETPPDSRLFDLPSKSDNLKKSRVAIAEIVILKVDDRSSAALVTYSTDAVREGDIIEKR